jgi:hypothetical protein
MKRRNESPNRNRSPFGPASSSDVREGDIVIADGSEGWLKRGAASLESAAIEITTLLKPWREIDITKDPPVTWGLQLGIADDAAAEIQAGQWPVSDQIRLAVMGIILPTLVSFFSLSRPAIVANRKRARDAMKAITKLEEHLSWLGGDEEFPKLYAELACARQECKIISNGSKEGGGKSLVKRQCAETALRLINEYSMKPVTNGSSDCPYRAITAILYRLSSEGTGTEDADLRHICTDVLKTELAAATQQQKTPRENAKLSAS